MQDYREKQMKDNRRYAFQWGLALVAFVFLAVCFFVAGDPASAGPLVVFAAICLFGCVGAAREYFKFRK